MPPTRENRGASGSCLLTFQQVEAPHSVWQVGQIRRVEMGLGSSIARRWRAAARLLALVAAVTVAIGVHPPHAGAAQPDDRQSGSHHGIAGHSHFDASCLQAEIDSSHAERKGAVPSGHADCSQTFTPLLRSAFAVTPAYVVVAVMPPQDFPFRQLITSFDPPPPRRG